MKSGKKLLWPNGKEEWDGVHIDDTNIIFFDKKWFLYYKGETFGAEPSETKSAWQPLTTFLGLTRNMKRVPCSLAMPSPLGFYRKGVAGFGYGTFWSEDGFHFQRLPRLDAQKVVITVSGEFCADYIFFMLFGA